MTQKLKLTLVDKRHKRKAFDCGYPDLNEFLAKSARVSSDKRMTRTFVLEDPVDPDTIIGYITLTYTSIDIPPQCRSAKTLKNPVPALLLAKMGISNLYKGSGHGKRLLSFAIKQAADISQKVGGVGLVIDAKDNDAKAYYLGRGGDDFEIIDETGLKLWLPIDICESIANAT